MSKKDYILLAKAIKAGKAGIGYESVDVSLVVNTIASYLASDNPRFNIVKFINATK